MHSRGFTLIIAVLISSVVLAIGLAMFNVAVKQTILSSTAKESQYAFYAADSGIECTSYWEYKPPTSPFEANPPFNITCNGQSITVSNATPTGVYDIARTFTVSMSPTGAVSSPCAVVIVQKNTSGPGSPGTQIESRGYNTCTLSDPRRTERAIRITQ